MGQYYVGDGRVDITPVVRRVARLASEMGCVVSNRRQFHSTADALVRIGLISVRRDAEYIGRASLD